jgi:dTDP-glucose pyrophosphorylase
MAGSGSRFSEKGYALPKPLIDVDGLPMIERVVDNLDVGGRYIYLVSRQHEEQHGISELLSNISPGCVVVYVDRLTEGAACTTLLAKELINEDIPLIIANCDQLVEWVPNEFLVDSGEKNLDGSIVVFRSNESKWSYVKTTENGLVSEVAEKIVISDMATVGIYYWRSGSDYVKYAEQMIDRDIRTNGEFYICPVYNQAIADGKKVGTFSVTKMYGLGTPEDLESYLLDL